MIIITIILSKSVRNVEKDHAIDGPSTGQMFASHMRLNQAHAAQFLLSWYQHPVKHISTNEYTT